MELDREDLGSPRTLMYALAREFRFPDWGENWNALYDFLSDLRWIDADRFVLVVHDVGRHGLSEPVGRLIEASLYAAHYLAREQRAFHLVLLIDWKSGYSAADTRRRAGPDPI